MTAVILSVVTIVALLWALRVEARFREIFNRLDRQQPFGGDEDAGFQDQVTPFR